METIDSNEYQVVDPLDLKGEALAWAVCAAYEIPAMILEGVVHVESQPAKWVPFSAEAMLRSLVLGRSPVVLVPNEIADRT